MEDTKLGVIESSFADLIWAHAPLTSGELVKLCQEELTWKKSSTYMVLNLKRNCGSAAAPLPPGPENRVLNRK